MPRNRSEQSPRRPIGLPGEVCLVAEIYARDWSTDERIDYGYNIIAEGRWTMGSSRSGCNALTALAGDHHSMFFNQNSGVWAYMAEAHAFYVSQQKRNRRRNP